MRTITKTYKRVVCPVTRQQEFYGIVEMQDSKTKDRSVFRSGLYRPEPYMAQNDAEKLYDDLIKEGRIQ